MDEATNKMSSADWDEDRSTSTQRYDSNVASATSDDYDQNTEQIRAEIEDTRAEMSQTINEIQERLSPEHLMGQVKETVREATIGKVERVMDKVGETIGEVAEPAREVIDRAGTAIKETGRSVGNSVWRNPIPVALIGLGLGMLAMRKFRGGNGYDDDYETRRATRRYRRPNTLGQMDYESTESLDTGTSGGGTLSHVKETASDLASRSTNALSNLGTKAKDTASGLGTRFSQTLQSNPLAVGAVAVAAGTAVGLMLPSTRFETEYIGETGERLVDSAEDVARGALDKVQSAAQQMTSESQPGS
ncbi:MAG TPA: DUF3618 domain-containing protein [Pyrinomonadaceae bacterium]|nr:DUF3618 domain-containing protein [Pyrinomonadaceae bacterium]